MIVIAEVDMSEGGKIPDQPDCATSVQIFAADGTDLAADLEAGLAAIAKCRLIREGHVFETAIHHSMGVHFTSHLARYVLNPDTGEVEPRP